MLFDKLGFDDNWELVEQNTALVVAPNLMALASTVGQHPLAATVVHNGSAIAAGVNGLRPLMHNHRSQESSASRL